MSDPDKRKLPSMSQPDAAVLGQLGEYRLLERLAEGGMGVVYKALHTQLDRVVALKVLPKGRTEDEQAIARFQREMKAVGRLDHPNIVRAHDARQIEGTRVLVMEYVDGLDLSELVDRLGPLTVADACELVRQAAVGLEYAHQHGLVHRDVKPSNLMLSRHGQVKILDLGLARVHAGLPAGQEMTAVGQVIGTPDYMAPEQASDSHTVDVRADLYSLGCTLYKLLAGQAPFAGPQYRTAFSKMEAHVRQPSPPLGRFRDDVPEELVAVVDRMLAKDPDDRFATPAEGAGALSRFTAGSDLSRLLAVAEGQPEPPPRQFRPAALADQAATPPVTLTPRVIPPETPGRRRRTEVWWRTPQALVVALALLVLAVGLTVASLLRPAQQGGGHAERAGDEEFEPSPAVDETAQGTEIWQIDLDDPPSKPLPPRGGLPAANRRRVNDWIVLHWTPVDRGKPDLWFFAPNAKRRLPLTRSPKSVDFQPKFSPDARRVAFVRAAAPGGPAELWMCNADGTGIRRLVTGHGRGERLLSPVWVSNSRIYYARVPAPDPSPEGEGHLDGEHSRLVFRFQDALRQNGGLVTDVSPDGRQLAVIARNTDSWPTSDVYVTDLTGRLVATVWEDAGDDRIDANALWSPDGKKIAWQHHFTPGVSPRPRYFGVGLARLGSDGEWTAQVQPEQTVRIMPLAWAPNGRLLLCARIHDDPQSGGPQAALFLMDDRFEPAGTLFDLPGWGPRSSGPNFGRVADWAILPPDASPPPPALFQPR